MTSNPIRKDDQDRSEHDKLENELKGILKASDKAEVISPWRFKCTARNSAFYKPQWDA